MRFQLILQMLMKVLYSLQHMRRHRLANAVHKCYTVQHSTVCATSLNKYAIMPLWAVSNQGGELNNKFFIAMMQSSYCIAQFLFVQLSIWQLLSSSRRQYLVTCFHQIQTKLWKSILLSIFTKLSKVKISKYY